MSERLDDITPIDLEGECPWCGRTENGFWFNPCPSDDCPSHDEIGTEEQEEK